MRNVLVSMLILTSPLAAADRGLPAADVLQRHVEAVGGLDAIRAIHGFHLHGAYQLAGLDGTVDLYFQRPGRLRFTVELPGVGRIERGMMDGQGWSVEPGQGARVFRDDDLNGMRKWAARGFSVLPGSAGVEARGTASRVDFDGRECHAVEMAVAATGETFVDYYDVETGLLAGRKETVDTASGRLEMIAYASDYERFGRLLVATRWRHVAGPQEWTATYETVELVTPPASAFAPPPAVAALPAATED